MRAKYRILRHAMGWGRQRSGGFLSETDAGTSCRVIGLHGGGEFRRKLMDQGIFPGQDMRILQNDGRGPLLILLEGTRIALGRQIADRIVIHGTQDEGMSKYTFGRRRHAKY